jgi:5-methylcytosine-specific restriction protein A
MVALVDELRSSVDVPEEEGAQHRTLCRGRSRKNRLRKLDLAAGTCEGCRQNFRVGFGARGDRALEIHHLRPLRETPGKVDTPLADLVVLCASCHRLIHADPNLRVESLRAGWARIRSET